MLTNCWCWCWCCWCCLYCCWCCCWWIRGMVAIWCSCGGSCWHGWCNYGSKPLNIRCSWFSCITGWLPAGFISIPSILGCPVTMLSCVDRCGVGVLLGVISFLLMPIAPLFIPHLLGFLSLPSSSIVSSLIFTFLSAMVGSEVTSTWY